jgi:hypothetical protein
MTTRVLVSTAEPISAELLRSVAGELIDDAEVLVVSPATTGSPLRFWVSDVDEAIAHAERVQAETVERLAEDGVQASGEVGDSEPLQAIEDALRTFPADRIVVIAHDPHDGDGRDYREDDDLAAQARERFGLPVDVGAVTR